MKFGMLHYVIVTALRPSLEKRSIQMICQKIYQIITKHLWLTTILCIHIVYNISEKIRTFIIELNYLQTDNDLKPLSLSQLQEPFVLA